MRAEITLFSMVVAAALSAAMVVVIAPANEALMQAGDKPVGQQGGAALKQRDEAGRDLQGSPKVLKSPDDKHKKAGARPGHDS